ncbi:cysteine desulfurase [Candidatus Peregrinibacteria bacterium]|nr:cysteine desulfurase [Candidatus Peregrinibacteria bacterium]
MKSDFPLLKKRSKLVYFDSAATSQKPKAVIDAEAEWYETLNANTHRAVYDLAEKATEAYEAGRADVARFIDAPQGSCVVFTKGATESINLVVNAWARHNLKKGDTILLTEMEHHANIVPWQLLADEKKLKIEYWPITDDGELSPLPHNSSLVTGHCKLLSLTHISNVLGTINPLKKIIPWAREQGIKVLVDAAQSVPHMPVSVRALDPDFLVFSGHKMLGPTGIGALVIKKERLAEMQPWQGGGEMIERVSFKESAFAQPPWKFEAGTQPLAQVHGLRAAIRYIEQRGIKAIEKHTRELTTYAFEQLSKIPGVTILGPAPKNRGAVISFTVAGLHPHDLATFLNRYGICIRAGNHCAMPLHERLGIVASARVSFHLYNEKTEIDFFIKSLKAILNEWTKNGFVAQLTHEYSIKRQDTKQKQI